jgi:uncharacterized protein (TIGR01319 family)
MDKKERIIITDIGSTTTKALLLKKNADSYELIDIRNSPTTVEHPYEDVCIGIYDSIKLLEQAGGETILSSESTPEELRFPPDISYLTTSSAGGGLQIVVIGLTMHDSASSGKRVAYGVGGVILDTFAVDDKRSILEQMNALRSLHPDIIIMAGGFDDGAIYSLLRLGEILQIAKPKPKFSKHAKIPLVYAGNQKAQNYIRKLFEDHFELYIEPNIRPSLSEENLAPARNRIHDLFMENVMEHAPGYHKVKKQTASNILPTPLGVINSLQTISAKLGKNVMAVDIGGATTDIFSNIMGYYFRTVSANFGMSYSATNVCREAGFDKIRRWIPDNISDIELLNYIGNKTIFPNYIPLDDSQQHIEYAIAREAIVMSLAQHLEMNFNTKQIGFLDRLKFNRTLDKITEAFYFEDQLEKRSFNMLDISVLIAAGGVVSHADDKQILTVMNDAFEPKGITEIWKDSRFISPHLGQLSTVDKDLAAALLIKYCYKKVGLVIRPLAKKWKAEMKVLSLHFEDGSAKTIESDQLYYLPASDSGQSITIKLQKGFYLSDKKTEFGITNDIPILIDTRYRNYDFAAENEVLQLYDAESDKKKLEICFDDFRRENPISEGTLQIIRDLPYKGDILVQEGEEVSPDTVIGENKYDPPRIYVLSFFDKTHLKLDPESFAESLLVKDKEEIKIGQKILQLPQESLIDKFNRPDCFTSPVRGRIESIQTDSGIIILREIQDYSTKPQHIPVSTRLNINPKHLPSYMKHKTGDFVYAGDVIAKKWADKKIAPKIVHAPITGWIKKVDRKTGKVTIQYDKEPYKMRSMVYGRITAVTPNFNATIEISGSKLQGILGIGKKSAGIIHFSEADEVKENAIVIISGKLTKPVLDEAKKIGVRGIVTASMDYYDLAGFMGSQLGVAITGTEDVPFPIIITEGFGNYRMNAEYTEFLRQQHGQWGYISAHTQIRAGVKRPELLVIPIPK